MLVRRNVFETCGLFDENYFLYYEEVDLCRRANRAAFGTWYVPAARVVHLVGRSSGVVAGAERPRRQPGYWFEARRRYFVKHHGLAYARLADICWGLGFVAWRTRRRIQRKPDFDPPHLWADFWRHSACFVSNQMSMVVP
jgi:GT2 family glycosyltransferase